VGLDDAGDTVEVSATPRWWSDDSGIATLDASGVVATIAVGETYGETYIHAELTDVAPSRRAG